MHDSKQSMFCSPSSRKQAFLSTSLSNRIMSENSWSSRSSAESYASLEDSRSTLSHGAENVADETDLSRSVESSVSLEGNSKLHSIAANMNKKRRYTYKVRKKSDNFVSSLQMKRASKLRKLGSPSFSFNSSPCCKRSCVADADHEFLSTQVEKVLQMNQEERRNYLSRMMHGTKRNHFQFNEKRVCTRFLVDTFGFSRYLICSVKGTHRSLVRRETSNESGFARVNHEDKITTFLRRLADNTAERMPDTTEFHLPFIEKKQVYQRFLDEYKILYGDNPPSQSYFLRIWKQRLPEIKIRKRTRFTICHECETIRSGLNSAGTNVARAAAFREKKTEHQKMIRRERQGYSRKCEEAKLYPEQFMSVIVDGADQSAFGLPHFTFSTKNTSGHSIKIKLVGVLEHGSSKSLSLYVMTEEFETGSNHIIEAIHRTLQKKSLAAPKFPPVLYIQLDNCVRENKNRFTLAYLECLVAWGVFAEVQASFLPIGHTHADIDQTFSCTSGRLKTHDAITLSDLMKELKLSYTPSPTVTEMTNVVNFSGLCRQENCIRNVRNFTRFRFFKFNRAACGHSKDMSTSEVDSTSRTGSCQSQGTPFFRTNCTVKMTCDAEWIPLWERDENIGFLHFVPDLSETPPTKAVSPTNYDQVTKRFISEQGRINNTSKMNSLFELRDRVYDTRLIPFHWDLSDCFELNLNLRTDNTDEWNITNCAEDIEYLDTTGQFQHQDLEYEPNAFVAVRRSEESNDIPFWLAKIRNVLSDDRGKAISLEVHWWELKRGSSMFTGSFAPSFISKGNRKIAWIDKVSVESIHVTFDRLSSSNKINTRTATKIRQCLS